MNIKVILLLAIIFFISEISLMVLKRSKKMKSKVSNDQKSLLVFWIVIPTSITLGFMFANYLGWNKTNVLIAAFGILTFSIGVILRWTAITQLAEAFTVNVSINKNHQLKTTGLYRLVRHPSYTGLLLIVFGLSIAMNSLSSILIVSIPIFLALAYRIKVEEKELLKEFKTAYQDYTKKTKSLLPFVY